MSKCRASITDAGEIPADILAKLEALPNNAAEVIDGKRKLVDAALKRFYGKKSMDSIAKVCGVSHSLVHSRVAILKQDGEL